MQNKKNNKTIKNIIISALVLIAITFICIASVLIYKGYIEVRNIDCMPPLEKSEQECLDKGRCACVTY